MDIIDNILKTAEKKRWRIVIRNDVIREKCRLKDDAVDVK